MHDKDDISIMTRAFIRSFKDPRLFATKLVAETTAILIAQDFKKGNPKILVEIAQATWDEITVDIKIYIEGDDTQDADLQEIHDKAYELLHEMIEPIGTIYEDRVLVDFCD